MSIRTNNKHVGKLVLKAPTEDAAHHCAVLIEDALNTATIPGAYPGRIVVIKQLNLGKIRQGAGSMDVSLHIEKALRTVASNAVSGDSVHAGNSDVVIFRDVIDAAMLFIQRCITRQSMHEWFWPEVFPEFKKRQSAIEKLIIVVDSVICSSYSISGVTALMERILRADLMLELMTAASDEIIIKWLYHLKLDHKNKVPEKVTDFQQFKNIDAVHLVSRLIQKFGTQNIRSFFLAAVALVKTNPAFQTRNEFSSYVHHFLISLNNDSSAPTKNHNLRYDCNEFTDKKSEAPTDGQSFSFSVNCNKEEGDRLCISNFKKDKFCRDKNVLFDTDSQDTAADSTSSIMAEELQFAPKTEKWVLPGLWTPNAGLLFLVPVMERLGILEFMEMNYPCVHSCFAGMALLQIGKKLGMTPDDPLNALAVTDDMLLVQPGSELKFPEKLRNILIISNTSIEYDSIDNLWLRGIRRWCRRYLKMGLVNLVKRTGLVSISNTHMDISFELDQADIRIRRQALDVDPGWVPWLGKVIRFHYGDNDEF